MLAGVLGKTHRRPAVAGGEIWVALDAAGMPVSMEETIARRRQKIAGALMIETLYQDDAEAVGRAIGQAIPASRYRRLSRALRNRPERLMKDTAAFGGNDRAAPDRTPRDDRGRRILDRRAYRRGLAGGAGRFGLLSRRRRHLHQTARAALLGIGDADMVGLRPATEAYALLLARRMRERHGAIWGLGETGATGPTGNRYGDPAGHTCIAVAGPGRARDHAAHRQRRAAFEYGCLRQTRA